MADPNPPFPPPPPRQPSGLFFGPAGLRPGWGLLLFLILLTTVGSTLNLLVSPLNQPPSPPNATVSHTEITPTHLLLNEGASLLAVLLATLSLAHIERRPFRAYGLGGTHKLSHLLQGLLWGALCLSLLVATLRLTGFLRFDALLLHGPAVFQYALLWAISFTLVAFFEETLLRGYLQFTLTRALTPIVEALSNTPNPQTWAFWTAALILSFVFGLGHGSNPGESPIGLLAAGCAGLVFCLALYRTGSLWWALGMHAAWDWAQSFLYGVPDSGGTIRYHLFATHPIGPPVLSGGLTGPEGSLFVLPILALIAAIILLTLPHDQGSSA